MPQPKTYNLTPETYAGYTLVEVLAALAVVSIALVGLIRLDLTSLAVAEKAERIAEATLLAQSRLAEVEGAGFPPTGVSSGTEVSEQRTYTWQTQVTDLHVLPAKDPANPGLRKVVVTVGWDHGPGRRSIDVSTVLARRSLP